ncbi:MAG TPA: patatin-like phospholipase family protein [Elusimicrobiales bacterium]|nr:patatin-like phospholipase family protein [Elusimicrobiales bacterium]
MNEKKTAIFLCGGGALGAWQSGALSFINEKKIDAQAISGFSIGAINSAFYCFNSVDKIEKIWSKMDNKKIFKFSLGYSRPVDISIAEENKNPVKKIISRIENFLSGVNLFSNKPVYKILSKYISKKAEFKKNLKFYCISHCVERSAPYITEFDSDNYERNRFIKMVVASSTIPFIFPQVKEESRWGEVHLVDGGVIGRENINFSFFEGFSDIFVISNVLDEDYYFKPRSPFSITEIFEKRLRRILVYQNKKIIKSLSHLKSKPNIHLINPLKPLDARIMDFDGKKAVKLFEDGRKTAMEFFKKL